MLVYNTIFPLKQTTRNIFLEHDTTELITLSVNHPVTVNLVNLNSTNSYVSFYALPKDTLEIWLDLSINKSFKENIVFKGKTASISYYLSEYKTNTSTVPGPMESVDAYNIRVDSITKTGLKALRTYNKNKILPDWFAEQEENDILYAGARDKISQFLQSFLWYNKLRPRINKLMDQLNVKVDNPDARFSESYYEFLCGIVPEQYDTLLTPQNRTSEVYFNFIKENINTAQYNLHSEIKDIFIAQRICSYLSIKAVSDALSCQDSTYFQHVDTLIAYAKTNLADTVILNVLLSYCNDQIRNANSSESLTPGTNAPDFKLTGITGNSESLSDFKVKLVFINFWATWCSPCIKSIPEKNELFNEYSIKGIVFLNVCMDMDRIKWRKLIKENNYQGIHLICNEEWGDFIRKSYHINSVPHYTLIDKNGEIIMNRVAGIEELQELIKKQL